MGVISLRLKDRDLARIEELAELQGKDRSTVARELIEQGWELMMVRLYKLGKISLAGLAAKLDLSVSQALDLLTEMGIESPVEFDDYLQGFECFR
ncbi:MAG: ribbon-helix-helix protein, CopG family [Deltaproteobacteria bacterium]|nr:ribbon-helix-helix protein, CopG family [Deltaproteobacteria bacterium]